MPGIDADEVVVGANGNVYVAPLGTAAPVDPTTPPAAAWIDIGYTTEDGIEQTPSVETNEVRAWQAFYPIRRTITGRGLTIGFSILQWNKNTVPFAFGGGSVVQVPATAGPPAVAAHSRYNPPAPGAIDERAMIVHWVDGSKIYRLVIPKGMNTDLGASSLTKSDASALPITFTVLGTDGADPFYLITNDPAFAA